MNIQCNACKESYDSDNKAPMILPCSHTFCRSCLSKLRELRCPSCMKGFDEGQMVKNCALLEVIAESKYFCSNHPNVPANFFCSDDKQAICSKCHSGEHRDHGYQIITDLVNEYKEITQEEKLNRLANGADCGIDMINKYLLNLGMLESAARAITNDVHSFFDSAESSLKQQRALVISKIDSFFSDMKLSERIKAIMKKRIEEGEGANELKRLNDSKSLFTELKIFKDVGDLKELAEKLTRYKKLELPIGDDATREYLKRCGDSELNVSDWPWSDMVENWKSGIIEYWAKNDSSTDSVSKQLNKESSEKVSAQNPNDRLGHYCYYKGGFKVEGDDDDDDDDDEEWQQRYSLLDNAFIPFSTEPLKDALIEYLEPPKRKSGCGVF